MLQFPIQTCIIHIRTLPLEYPSLSTMQAIFISFWWEMYHHIERNSIYNSFMPCHHLKFCNQLVLKTFLLWRATQLSSSAFLHNNGSVGLISLLFDTNHMKTACTRVESFPYLIIFLFFKPFLESSLHTNCKMTS